jgi:hypothetical protein
MEDDGSSSKPLQAAMSCSFLEAGAYLYFLYPYSLRPEDTLL